MKRILCVDDDQDILDVVQLILEGEDYEVKVSLSPDNIFSIIQDYKPEMILLDIQLGSYNGLDICKAIKSYLNTETIPVIVISSDERLETAKSDFCADEIIKKPFSINSLIDTIRPFFPSDPLKLA